MPVETFQFICVTRVLGESVELAEALAVAEVSALGDSEGKRRSCLEGKIKAVLQDDELAPAISLHRRKIVASVELATLDLAFEPPRRSPDWEQPVRLRVHFACWAEDDFHHAWVPALGMHVFATRAGLLPERVEAHVRLLLAGRGRRLNLERLARLARVEGVSLDRIELSASRKTPKELAQAGETVEEEKTILEKLAEELPPPLARSSAARRPASAGFRTGVPAAFEMEIELRQLAELLAAPYGRSVLLVGPPGCGKTALVRELARRRGEFGFGHTPFWSTTGARLMAGPIGFGMWQQRCQELCREVSKRHAVLHLNNVAELLEVGKATRGEQSVGSFLRPWIARGEILALAECTPEQAGALERNEPHIFGAFHLLNVPERTPEQIRTILERVFAAAPGKEPPEGNAAEAALARLHELHRRYATYSANPGRPLRFLQNLLSDCFPEKDLSEGTVVTAFSRETGLPPVLLDDAVPLDIEATRGWLSHRVIGQPEAIGRVVDLLVLIKARLVRPRKPLASFLFIGPTGTGKTEMAKALAGFLFGDASRLVRFDLNEYSDPISVQRLIGGPAAGDAEGLLTARVREQPFSVLLLDEFEKADPSFFDLLLQVLGDGRLTDAAGRVADFCNSVIVMTSNLGAQEFQRGAAGFRVGGAARPDARQHFAGALRSFLRPEVFNRLDAIVPFESLTPAIVLAIARRHLDLLRQRDGIRLRPIAWRVQPAVADYLAARGYDARYGARPLKRIIERELLVPLAEALNSYPKNTALDVRIGVVLGRIHVQVRARPEGDSHAREEASETLAERIVAERRRISRLEQCPAAGKIDNEVVMLESLERRLTAAQRKAPQFQSRLSMLPKLRECLRALAGLSARACEIEAQALGELYRREPIDSSLFSPALGALEQDRLDWMRELFRRQFDQPDDVVLAFYSERRETLIAFAGAFYSLGVELGQVGALHYFLPPSLGRGKARKLSREIAKDPGAFWAAPPDKVIAIVLQLHGDLFLPRFQSEAGLHVVTERNARRVCLIESSRGASLAYEPPEGIERQGAIESRGTPLCRTYDRGNEVVHDEVLGELPWTGPGLASCLAALTEQRLDRAIQEIAG